MPVRIVSYALVGVLALTGAAFGQTPSKSQGTITTLTVQQDDAIATSAGAVVLLRASVTSGSSAVTHGLVKFCDASASQCAGLSILGTAQLDTLGAAAIHIRLGPGKHSIRAVFCGTPRSNPPVAAGASLAQAITIQPSGRVSSGGAPR